jgi:hypothetical protein
LYDEDRNEDEGEEEDGDGDENEHAGKCQVRWISVRRTRDGDAFEQGSHVVNMDECRISGSAACKRAAKCCDTTGGEVPI